LLGGSGADQINNTITANSNQTFSAAGGGGDDTISLATLDDAMQTLNGGAGTDVVVATSSVTADWSSFGQLDGLTITSGGGTVTNLTVDVDATGATAALSLTATGSAAVSFAGGTGTANTLVGAAGDDTLQGGGSADTLTGNGGADTLLGGADADQLSGGSGDDSIVGGDGADTLTGGSGADTLVGGSASDVFRYTGSTTAEFGDSIAGFESGTDTLALNVSSATGLFSGVVGTDGVSATIKLITDGGGGDTNDATLTTGNTDIPTMSVSAGAGGALTASAQLFTGFTGGTSGFTAAVVDTATSVATGSTFLALGVSTGGELFAGVVSNATATGTTRDALTSGEFGNVSSVADFDTLPPAFGDIVVV